MTFVDDYSQYNPKDPGTLTKVPPVELKTPDIANQRLQLEQQKQKTIDEPLIENLRGMQHQYQSLAGQRTPIPRDPQFTQPPAAPKLDYSDPIKAFQNPGVFIATLGSLFSRAPMTAALNAGGAAMEAYHKGEAEVFAQKREEWKENLEVALAKNRIALDKLNNEWKKSDATVHDRLAKLQAIAAGEKMDTVIAAIQGGHFDKIDGILEGLQKSQDKLNEIHERVQAVDSSNVDSAVDMIGQYKMAPLTGWTLRSPFGQQVVKGLNERYPEYKAENYFSKLAKARAVETAEPRALSAALTGLEKQRSGVKAYADLANRNGAVLVDLGRKVDQTGLPVVERWLRAGMQATGDPDVAAFHSQLFIYRAEIARVLTQPNLTGQLTDTARKEVEEFTQGGISLGQLKAVTKLLKEDSKRREDTLDSAIAEVKGQLRGGGSTSPTAPTSDDGGWTDMAPGVRFREKRSQTDTGTVLSDVTPDPIRAGQQYAMSRDPMEKPLGVETGARGGGSAGGTARSAPDYSVAGSRNYLEGVLGEYAKGNLTAKQVQDEFKARGWTVSLRKRGFETRAYDPSGNEHWLEF